MNYEVIPEESCDRPFSPIFKTLKLEKNKIQKKLNKENTSTSVRRNNV